VSTDTRHAVGPVPPERWRNSLIRYGEEAPEQEQLALLTFDPIGAMAATDRANLEALLEDVRTDDAALRQTLHDLAEREGLTASGIRPEGPGTENPFGPNGFSPDRREQREPLVCPACGHEFTPSR
jgi:hypothetical protein